MRIPIFITVIIVAAAVGIGWHNYQRLQTVRETQATLVRTAADRGFILDPAHPTERVRITKSSRVNREIEAKVLDADFTEYYIELSALRKGGMNSASAIKKLITTRGNELHARLNALDASQLKIILNDVLDDQSLDEETRQIRTENLIRMLGEKYPQEVLAILLQSPDLFKQERMMGGNLMLVYKFTISSAIGAWAKSDPKGAIEWIKKHGAEFPDLMDDNAKTGVISAAAKKDPKFAFDHIADMEFKNPRRGVESIAQSASTPEEKIATLAALRECLSGTANDQVQRETMNNVIQRIMNVSLIYDGFEITSGWIDKVGLSPEEQIFICNALDYNGVKLPEIGQWVEWIDRTVPAGKADATISKLVNRWTNDDHQAAGNWLASAPENPAKNVAVRSFAETVAKYDPETAAQWALSLPAGEGRERTLKTIYENWPKDDAVSKAAFAKQHGIK